MIVTVTPNPSVDRTLFLESLARGEVVRAQWSCWEPSGKGVNVALALSAEGHRVKAIMPLGGPPGLAMRAMLDESGLDYCAVQIAGETRSNISIVEPDGTVTKLNEPGPLLTEDEVGSLVTAAIGATADAQWLVGSGSLPGGSGSDVYACLAREAKQRGIKTAIDTSGSALKDMLPAGPDLVKPNSSELSEAVGMALRTLGDVIDACQDLRGRGAGTVLASLGADGAVLVDATGIHYAEATPLVVVSSVGAGDAMLAGFLANGGSGPMALHGAMQWAASAVRTEGTLYRRQTAVAVSITSAIERKRVLSETMRGPTRIRRADVYER